MLRGKLCALWVLVLLVGTAGWAEFQVNGYTSHDQTHAAVAMSQAGDFVVVWRSHPNDGRGGGVYARCFGVNGTAKGPEFQVNTSRADVDNWTPAVALAPTGEFVIAWVASRDKDCDIVGRLFDSRGVAITEEFQINDASPNAPESMPKIAANALGDFVVVWTRWSNVPGKTSNDVLGRVYRSDGTPQCDQFVVSECPHAYWPDVDMDDSGRFVVTWIRMGDNEIQPYGEYIMFRRYEADGTPLTRTVQVTEHLNSRWYGPSVAVDGSGEFAITWAIGPFPYDVVAQHFDSDGEPATEPYMINTYLEGNQGRPRVAADGDGRYLIVWESQDQDGSSSGVFSQWCSQGGDVIGAECRMNTRTQGRQWYPDVALGAGGTYVVVWISENQDGSGYGIFGEIGTR